MAALETPVLLMLQPVLTLVWAIAISGETVSAVQWMGVALVLGGAGHLTVRGSMKESHARGRVPLPDPLTPGPPFRDETAP